MRRIDAVKWLRLSFLLALAHCQLVHCIQVAPDPKPSNNTQSLEKKEPTVAADNTTLTGDSVLSASERTRRLIPYMAFYLPRDFPINQQYAIQGPKGAAPISGKHTKPIYVQGPLTPANGQQQLPVPQSYMNLRAPSPGIPSNGELFAAAPQQQYLQSAGEVYHQMAYTAAGPPPSAIQQHSQPAAPPLSQSLVNTKGSNLPVVHLLPPGPPGPNVGPIAKHRHKTVQHFPPTKPPALQQLPYEHLQPQLLEPQRHKANRHQQLQQHQHQHQQQQPIFVSQQQQHQQHPQLAPASPFRQQTRPKQSKLNLTPFTPSNTLPGHFIPIIYTPVSGNDNDNNNNNNHDGNTLNYDYGHPTVVLVDDLSPPIETSNLQQQHQQQQQQEQIQQQYRPSTLPNSNNEYTLVASIEQQQTQQQQQQQQHQLQQQQHQQQQQLQHQQQHHQQQLQQQHHEQQQLQQQQQQEQFQQQQQHYISETNAPSPAGVLLSSQQAELPTGSAGSSSLNPHSTTSPIYHIINEVSAPPVHPIASITPSKQQPQQQQTYTQQHSHSHRHSNQQQQKHSNYQSPRPENFFTAAAPSQDLQQQQQQQHESLHQDDSTAYVYLNDEIMTPQEKYVRYLQQRIRYNKQQHKQRERVKERENAIKLQQLQSQSQSQSQQQQPQLQIVALSETDNSQSAPTPPPLTQHPTVNQQQQQQQQLDANTQISYPQHSPIRHAVYPYPELHVPSNHQPPANVATEKQVVKIPVRTLVSEALDAFQQQQQQLAAKGPSFGNSASGVAGLYGQQSQYANGLGSPASQYIDYIVDDPKQSLDDEHHPIPTPTVIVPDGNNQDYYDTTSRPSYKQQPTLRLKPISKSKNYVTRRPTAVELQPPPAPQPQPPPPAAQSVDKPQYIYADSNFGEKMSKTAVKLRPSHKFSGGISSRLSPPAPPQPQPHAAPLATSHQFQGQPPANLPQYYNPPVPVAAKTSTPIAAGDPNQLPDIRTSSLAEILHKLQASNHLPKTLTPENIDNSIKTLVTILENLKQTQTIVQNPQQHHERPSASPDYDYGTGSEEVNGGGGVPDLSSVLSPLGPNKHPGPSTGRAGIDYPNYADIPQTNFNCGEQRYKGFFGDPETNCQVWHYCDLNGGKASFLCPNGTIFSQIALTCDWWFNVKCSTTAQLYVLNERLYKYILPFTPKFPEDYSGPLVDKYLAMKFQEMEEKMRIEKEKAAEKAANDAAIGPTADTEPHNNNEIVDGAIDAENDDNAPVTAVIDTEVTTITDPRPRTLSNVVGGGHNKLGAINAHVSEQSSERNLLIDDEVDDISKRGGVDTFESSTIPTASAASVAAKQDGLLIVSMKPIVVSSTQIPAYEDEDANTYIVRNVDDATSRTTDIATEPLQATTQSDIQQVENQEEIQASPKPVRQAAITNIDVEKVEVIEIKSEEASGQMGPKMYYGAESAKDAR